MGFGKDLVVGISTPHGTAEHLAELAGTGLGNGEKRVKSPGGRKKKRR